MEGNDSQTVRAKVIVVVASKKIGSESEREREGGRRGKEAGKEWRNSKMERERDGERADQAGQYGRGDWRLGE